jgi:hypothetical protein
MQHYRANSYHEVNEFKTVWVKTGSVPGNSYFGASRIYDVTGVEFLLAPGDQLHNLVGGLFAITSAGTYEVLRKSPTELNMHFCKDYTAPSWYVDKILNEKCDEIPKSQAYIPTTYNV